MIGPRSAEDRGGDPKKTGSIGKGVDDAVRTPTCGHGSTGAMEAVTPVPP